MLKLTISESEYRTRIDRVKEILVNRGLDALYLTNGISFFYLTGFSYIATERPAALVIPVEGEITFMGPLLEIDHIPMKTRLIQNIKTYFDYPGKKHPIDHFAKILGDMGLANKPIGIDNLAGAAGIWGYSGPAITEVLPKAKFVVAKDIIQNMRLIKSEGEIALIRESAKWANLAHSLLQEYTSPGLWDFDVATAASHEASLIMKKTLGHDYEPQRWGRYPASAGFRGQVGEMAAIPHSIATRRPMKEGDVLVTGAGADVGGYSCELERTLFLGKPMPKQQRYFKAMVKAQEKAFEVIKPGAKCSSVDKATTRVFKQTGFGQLMRHHTGHGIGLEGHEPPWLDVGNDAILKPGMVISCEPGIYEQGFGGFRHSDSILVTQDGAEIITYYPRGLDALTILSSQSIS
ncbi:MAG: aminopeptidase P family protein [Candidatus Bathyarchaeota archaeon]|nr:MAG: aminopeptidase P family protein [Candidatus Bathyarchaeota archaeon]